MSKVKINKFNGIYTNIDENDSTLEYFRDSLNFRHENGYAQFEPRNLSEYSLPDVDAFYEETAGTWQWETGIYTLITSDPFDMEIALPAQYRALVLVAKKQVGNDYYRSFWLKDIDNGSWLNLEDISGLGQDLLKTDREGAPKFIVDRGALKVFLPHDSFWIGHLSRTSKTISSYGASSTSGGASVLLLDDLYEGVTGDTIVDYTVGPHNNFYMDRLTEKLSTEDIKDSTNHDIETGQRASIQDDLMRLRLITQVFPITVSNADATTAYKYFMARRQLYTGGGGQFGFKFEKLTSNRSPTGEFLSIPVASGWSGSILYFENATGESTITTCSPVQTNECLDYHDAYHKLPQSLFDYNATLEGVATNAIDYWYDRVERSPFIGQSDWVVTCVLDETTEIVVEKGNINITPVDAETPTDSEKYFLRWAFHVPTNINKRLTRIRFYVKQYTYDVEEGDWTPNPDYELVEDLSLLKSPLESDSDIDLYGTTSTNDLTGTFLSQNIGVSYDSETYEVLTGFRDFAIEHGIGAGLEYNDYVNVYHSTVGGGVLQSDLVYRSNKIDLSGVAYANAVVAFNNKILVITSTTTHVITTSETAGVLAFRVTDTLQHGVKDKDDVALVQGGAVLNTRNGLYTTDGFTSQLVSEAINNIIKDNYATGRVYYNPALHEIYYTPSLSDIIYRYRIEQQKWEPLDTIDGSVEFLLDYDGNKAYLTDDTLYVNDTNDSTEYSGILTTNTSDLGESLSDKLINYIEVDFIGQADILVYLDGSLATTLVSGTTEDRKVQCLYIPLSSRLPSHDLKLIIDTINPSTILYKIELDINVLPRRKNDNLL